MTFNPNLEITINEVFEMISVEEREGLLKYFIGMEAAKKVKEVNKNYKDLRRFNPERFNHLLYDRLTKKLWSAPISDGEQNDAQHVEAAVVEAPQETKASTKAKSSKKTKAGSKK